MPFLNASSTPTSYRAETPEPARANDVLTRTGSVMTSAYACRDSEISAYGVGNRFYLRVSGDQAVYALIGASSVEIGEMWTGFDLVGTLPGYPFRLGQSINFSTIPSFVSTSPSDVWTLGTSGFDTYVKYNGTEVLRRKNYRLMQAGVAHVWGTAATTATVAYVPATLLGSNRAQLTIDILDVGAKSTSVQTTGSMAAGSNQLLVASAAGFAIGDPIIFETGGEAGLGRRGTEGVGGAWPALSFANATALLADTGQASGTHAWDRATGSVYTWDGAAWSNAITAYETYYTNKALPKALLATITGISGTTITLNKTAVVATAGARVFVDCTAAFAPLSYFAYSEWMPDYLKVHVPAGTFAVNGSISTQVTRQYNLGGYWRGVQIIGSGKTVANLFPPRGSEEIQFTPSYAMDALVSGFKVYGNHSVGTSGEIDGYLLSGMTTGSVQGNWPTAITPANGFRATVQDCSFESVFRSVIFNRQTDAWAYRCDVTMFQAVNAYTQWHFSHVDSVGGGMEDCTSTCPKAIKTFEVFNTHASPLGWITYRRCGGRNSLMSTNSSTAWLIDRWSSTITADSFKGINIGAGYLQEPVIYPSANAFHNTPYGIIRNPRIVVEGYPDTNLLHRSLIEVTSDCDGVIIEGEFTGATTPFSAALGGYFEQLPYVASGGKGMAILDGGKNTKIQGVRCVGTPGPSVGDITNSSAGGGSDATGSPIVQDCIANLFALTAGTTKSTNRTNAGVAVP